MVIVVADIVGSRRISDRRGFSEIIGTALSETNAEYEDAIVGKFSLTKGIDEFSGVLRSPKVLPEICAGIQVRLGSVGVRFSAVRGEVDIYEEGGVARGFDGPAFHQASSRMDSLERQGQRFGYLDQYSDQDELGFMMAGNLMTFCLRTIQGWPERTARVAARAWAEEDIGQAELAEELGVTQQSVSASLKRAEYDLLSDSIVSVGLYLGDDDGG